MVMTPYTEGFFNGRDYEQKRIIKLLEEHLGNMDWEDLVKLITKGSQSEDR